MLTRAQRDHLTRILAAGGTATMNGGPAYFGSKWSRSCLGKLRDLGFVEYAQGCAGKASQFSITDAGRAALVEDATPSVEAK